VVLYSFWLVLLGLVYCVILGLIYSVIGVNHPSRGVSYKISERPTEYYGTTLACNLDQ